MEIKLSGSTVRSWRDSDLDILARRANNIKVWRNLTDSFPHPYTISDARDWIDQSKNCKPETNFAIAIQGEAAGGIGFRLRSDVYRRSAEIGYWLAEEFWGQGIASEAVAAVSSYAFQSFDICRLTAAVFEWNPASMRVLEKAGYKFEGRLRRSVTKDGATIDSFLYALVVE